MPVGEQKTLIAVVSFLACFYLLVSFMPSYLLGDNPEYPSYNVPEYFEAVDIQSYACIWNITLNPDGEWKNNDFAGLILKVMTGLGRIYMWTQAEFRIGDITIFSWDRDYFHWYDSNGIEHTGCDPLVAPGWKYIKLSEIDEVYSETGSLAWTVKNGKAQYKVYFGFNETLYSTPSEAFSNSDLVMLVCAGYDQVNTSVNAWNLIGQILFFKMPNVHPVINALIAIPVWVAITWLVIVIILKFIPFVGD